MVILKNWSVCQRGNEWMAPELWTNYLQGNVYGHPRFSDGDLVNTSSIEDIRNGDGFKIVKTRNTEYALYVCKALKDAPVGSWCGEGLFQKVEIENE